ncbi:putative uncharacterized protein DDB_G0282133 [Mercenaria mercenaria]|uniref:putative uncharacterized protein DDB_G0282133 n=1 Tax=Mercenaria mercenaria TaxID=6596 RepID=UPI00234E7966|nr:putative uncharacterized protein DDB_G0282133 [Mercenaria mercenaria]
MSRENHDYDQANVSTDNTVNINSDSNYAHTYFVLEQHVNESYTDNTTYDTSGNANKTTTEQDNVYNRLETDNNKTYDHVHTKIRNGVLKFDDTYDTTHKAAMKLKARPGKDSDAFGETDEDACNHITSKQVTNTKTENEYGVPNTLENAYGDVIANNKNNTHDEGDTYSHINKKPQNKEKQGNSFSKSKQIHDSKMSEGNQDADYDVTDRDGKLLTADNDYSTIGTVH